MVPNKEEWNIFERRWDAFVIGSRFNPDNCSSQLFQFAVEALGDMLLKSDPAIISKQTSQLKEAMKSMAVTVVATGVIRAELVAMNQESDEAFRAFVASVHGKAETCSYTIGCNCGNNVDFTEVTIRDILIAGIYDTDIRWDVLGTQGILDQSINDVIALVESKEVARNALPASNASVSGYRRQNKLPDEDKTALRPDCNKKFSLYTENANGWNKKPHACCPPCFRIRRSKNCQDKKTQDKKTLDSSAQEASFSDIGGIFSQVSSVGTPIKVPSYIYEKGLEASKVHVPSWSTDLFLL